MRTLVIGAALIGSLVLSQTAMADHRFTQHGYGHGNFNSRGFDRRFNRNFGHRSFNNRFRGVRANPYHFGGYSQRGYRGGNNFVSLSYGNRFNRHGNRGWNGGNFVGGLVVGSLLSNSYSQPRVTERVVYRSAPVRQEVVYVDQNRTTRTIARTAPRRKLLRDLQGNCYQIDRTPNGDEIRTELAPQECSF